MVSKLTSVHSCSRDVPRLTLRNFASSRLLSGDVAQQLRFRDGLSNLDSSGVGIAASAAGSAPVVGPAPGAAPPSPSALPLIRRPPQDRTEPRPLHENGTNRSKRADVAPHAGEAVGEDPLRQELVELLLLGLGQASAVGAVGGLPKERLLADDCRSSRSVARGAVAGAISPRCRGGGARGNAETTVRHRGRGYDVVGRHAGSGILKDERSRAASWGASEALTPPGSA
jgi:hypothetical protein